MRRKRTFFYIPVIPSSFDPGKDKIAIILGIPAKEFRAMTKDLTFLTFLPKVTPLAIRAKQPGLFESGLPDKVYDAFLSTGSYRLPLREKDSILYAVTTNPLDDFRTNSALRWEDLDETTKEPEQEATPAPEKKENQ